ncbi:MAG: cell wall metabolism sensor histidine kinase WalK [Chloroflexi bacterium]|nr:cell wall metabolism sensor histidine kinase WalK [Chloroflexota bacterium]
MRSRAPHLSPAVLSLLTFVIVGAGSWLLTQGSWLAAVFLGLLTAAMQFTVSLWLLHTIRHQLTSLVKSATVSDTSVSLPETVSTQITVPELSDLVRTFNDAIRALHQCQLVLQQERDDLAAALSAVGEGVAIVAEHGELSYANPTLWSMAASFSAAPNASEGEPEGFLRTDGLPALIHSALRGKSTTETLTGPNAETRFQVRAIPLAQSHVPAGAAIIVRDLSDAQRLDRVRQEFVANASHELLTPIGTVRALADALARGGLDDSRIAKRFLRQLRTEADRLAALARELLELAQAQADELRLELSATDVNQVVKAVIERLTAQAGAAHIALKHKLDQTQPVALADPDRLEQVLVNLVHNALKFTPRGGKITLETLERDNDVLLRITDTGVGIAPGDLPRIFERFYKVRGVAPSPSGTGLGLAIVRHLVTAMQGEVWAESNLGKGTTFSIALQRSHSKPEIPTELDVDPSSFQETDHVTTTGDEPD